jgi:hypothetical protein
MLSLVSGQTLVIISAVENVLNFLLQACCQLYLSLSDLLYDNTFYVENIYLLYILIVWNLNVDPTNGECSLVLFSMAVKWILEK